jgi:hypothetical protein
MRRQASSKKERRNEKDIVRSEAVRPEGCMECVEGQDARWKKN